MAPNGLQLWGATLNDFYIVSRVHGLDNLHTHSTGSKLAAWMKAHGETYAADHLAMAEQEAEPELILPCDIGRLIKDSERVPFEKKTWSKANPDGKGKEPFSGNFPRRIPTLQQYIPQFFLPAKLVVHDPWMLLDTGRKNDTYEDTDYDWDTKEDIIHIYSLQAPQKDERGAADRTDLDNGLAKRSLDHANFLRDPHTKHRDNFPSGYFVHTEHVKEGPTKPPIYIVLPLPPNRERAPEAHLYISPAGKIGEGNHSYVYRAELEIPRNQLVSEEICDQCVFEGLEKRLVEEDGKDGEKRDPKWDELSGRYEWHVTKKRTAEETSMVDPVTGKVTRYQIAKAEFKEKLQYEGPIRAIESRVQYQDLSKAAYCVHLRSSPHSIHSLTSKVHVAAKLSMQNDRHLESEARNYHAFPRHFFQHWSGYNIVRPLHTPVPVGPVVPQFYGYYAVDQEEEKKLRGRQAEEELNEEDNGMNDAQKQDAQSDVDGDSSGRRSSACSTDGNQASVSDYLSPILLIEDCGKSIEISKLSADDRNECASLIYRFHEEGWWHGSVAQRNIVKQPGPLSAWPLERHFNARERGGLGKDWSFRLIDFGRSRKTTNGSDLCAEASEVTGWVFGYGNHLRA
ncbi:hypothetical protein CPC08DRAFT_683586 [Agrocybe pediades]|nr:hypothetical protein CPC08DRAFT_683586 [Agrocybe pediades]